MNALTPKPVNADSASFVRSWPATLELTLAKRDNKTRLTHNRHEGPLRVQRPFYPESDEACHIYLLHPPGGLVLGDSLGIKIHTLEDSQALITTPSAGKVYAVKTLKEEQQQQVDLQVESGGVLEWLPQETLVFNEANARLKTTIRLKSDAKLFAWDIVCLGRPASHHDFQSGRCDQAIQVFHDNGLILNEHNRFIGGSTMLQAPWGMGGAHTTGTLVATLKPPQEAIDALLPALQAIADGDSHRWGITQKGPLLILRYIGHSVRHCKAGFETAWHMLRPLLNGRSPCTPRIWAT